MWNELASDEWLALVEDARVPGRWTFEGIYSVGIASTMWDRDQPDEALVRWHASFAFEGLPG